MYMAEQTADPLNNVLLLIMGHDPMVCDDELNGVSFGRELPLNLYPNLIRGYEYKCGL